MKHILGSVVLLGLLTTVALALDPEDEEYSSGPLKLVFKGASPQFSIQTAENLSFVSIRLGSMFEAKPDGQKVPGRQVMSLASAHPSYEQGNFTTLDGQDISFVMMKLPLASLNLSECDGGAAPGFANASTATGAGFIAIKVFFGFAQQATFAFGFNNTVAALGNTTKFNIEATSWPFCSANNRFVVELHVRTGAKSAHPKAVDEVEEPAEANATSSLPAVPAATRKMLADDSSKKGPGSNPGKPERAPNTPFGPTHSGPRDPRVATQPRRRFALLAGGSSDSAVAFNLLPYAFDAVDGSELMNITVASAEQGENTVFSLEFPAFNSLYYDPTTELLSAEAAGFTAAEVASYTAAAAAAASPSPSPAVKNAGAQARAAGMSLAAAGLLLLALL